MYNFGGQRINEGGLRGSPRSQETKKKPSLNRVNDPMSTRIRHFDSNF